MSENTNWFTNLKDPNRIYFYSQRDTYGEFSNFYPAQITDHTGKVWPTTEHYFQAKKFENTEHEEIIRNAKTPGQAAKQGRSRSRPLRKDWEEVKENIMMEALRMKFNQHEDLKRVLVDTGDRILVEHTKNDFYWADGGCGNGKNRLGVLLMELRAEILANMEAN